MTPFDSEFVFGFGMSDDDKLCRAIAEKKYATAYSLLRKRKELLEGENAGRCLSAALECTPKLFGEVLRACQPGEYNGAAEITLSETGHRCTVSGNVLMLAAAMDQTEHMQILLDHGYDVNSASLASAQADIHDHIFFHNSDMGEDNRYCGVKSNHITCRTSEELFDIVWSINCCTPLAAAVACGSMFATELLLKQPGVWSRESSAVCRAAIAVMDERYWRQWDCIEQVFPTRDKYKLFSDVEDVLDEWKFPLGGVADICTVKQLRRMLKTGFYTEEDGEILLRRLEKVAYHGEKKKTEAKLLLVARTFPKVCRQPWAKGVLLRCYMRLEDKEYPCTKLLNCWKKLSGKVGDLTLALGGEDWRQPLRMMDLRRILPAIQDGGIELVVDSDALHSAWSGQELNFITRHIRLTRTPGLGGISGYAGRMLLSASPKTFSTAVKRGWIAGERKADLLEFTRHHECNPGLRHVILSMEQEEERVGTLPENWAEDPKWEYCKWWDTELVWENEEEGRAWFARLWKEKQTCEETARQYRKCRTTVNAQRFFMGQGMEVEVRHPKWNEIEVENDLVAAAVCGENPALLQVLLEEKPVNVRKVVDIQFSDHPCFNRIEGTTMTVAAALGKTEQMKVLLNAGYDPNEVGRGAFSVMCCRSGFRRGAGVAVSPVLAALLMGEEEAVKLLLEAGAELDLSRPACLAVLKKVGGESVLELAARLPDTGYEKLTEADREEIRNAGKPRDEDPEWENLTSV